MKNKQEVINFLSDKKFGSATMHFINGYLQDKVDFTLSEKGKGETLLNKDGFIDWFNSVEVEKTLKEKFEEWNATYEMSPHQKERIYAIREIYVCVNFLNNGWEPDWRNADEVKYCIAMFDDEMSINSTYLLSNCLCYFQSKEKAQQAIEILGKETIRKAYSAIINANQTFTVNGVSFTMIAVAGGTFQMGDTFGDDYSGESPVHSVTLCNYYIGETQVTQALWEAVMGSNPSYSKGDNKPVEQISWDDCQEFVTKLNAATGKKFRLPTEAEWEYAARGGNRSKGYKYSGSNDLQAVAWYYDNSDSTTHEVKTKAANELGIYDMSGNVWELCSDWYREYSSHAQTNPTGPKSGWYRILRGGSWTTSKPCSISSRTFVSSYISQYRGMRLVLEN